MWQAWSLAIAQLPERELRRPIIDTLLIAVVTMAALGFVLWRLVGELTRSWGGWSVLGQLGGITIFAAAMWFSFVLVENAILFLFADRIIDAVERRFYPERPPPGPTRWLDFAWSALRLVGTTIFGNLLIVPLYLLLPGANLLLFLLLNGYLLGRACFDAVALRRMDDRRARAVWRAGRAEFVVSGAISVALLTVPVVNLVVPVIGLAAAVHLMEQRRTLRVPLG